ncbi:hypothetical protein CERSUDRAFT_126542 [Gelatoporia subvermispora B]|uniref:F-box domain-containing protein n=1 Tax=Ceriporiopsis subvermispora (strain B) TaxID=914234 RepID=M2Q7B2_CERS8|nr:hypothetical protein CERSUDRAFT_126542 [Gelatoporia subvermispora B]
MALTLSQELFIQILLTIRDSGDTVINRNHWAFIGNTGVEDQQLSEGQKSWISVTHVCRLWRHMALASPIVWSLIRIPGCRPQDVPFVQMCLQRSGSTPVDILVEEQAITHVLKDIIDLVRLHADHIRCLNLVVEKTHEQIFRIDFPLPMLQTLELRAARAGDSNHFPRQYFIPDPSQLPSLRVLALENVDDPWEWDSSALIPLTSIELSGHYYGTGPSAGQYFGLLSTLCNLVTVKLIRFPIPIDMAADHNLAISLPALRHLTISHWPSHVRSVVDWLEIPLDASIHLTFYQSKNRPDEDHIVRHTIMRLLRRSAATSVHDEDATGDPFKFNCCAMSLSVWSDYDMEIQCRTSCLRHDTSGVIPLRINFAEWDEENGMETGDVMSDHLDGFGQAVASCGFECLHFAGPSMSDEESFIMEFLPHFPDIRLLEIEAIDPSGCITSLD